MFGKMKDLFTKAEHKEDLHAPMVGQLVRTKDVPDPTFAEEMLGPGFAIVPREGKLYAPIAGEIILVFDTLHAIALRTKSGAELMFHIGLDTVQEKGVGFEAHVAVGDVVETGDLLLSFDLEELTNKGYNMITPVILTNAQEFSDLEIEESKVATMVGREDVVYRWKRG